MKAIRGQRRLKTETAMARLDGASRTVDLQGDPVALTCPECSGPILQVVDGDLMPRYRCQVGHAFSGSAMLAGRLESAERDLWHLVSSFEEAARIAETLGRRANKDRRKSEAALCGKIAKRSRAQARVIRELIRRSV